MVDAFADWPTDVLRPSASLWDRLIRRVTDEAGQERTPIAGPSCRGSPWEDVAAGISCKMLATGTARSRVSMLVRLAPGAEYPPHRHADIEDLYLLSGELWINDRKLYPGDYNRALAGTSDHRVWSETGCTCVLNTSTRDVLL
jgi:anti-sigma factor ChrR (cupin superfamily)